MILKIIFLLSVAGVLFYIWFNRNYKWKYRTLTCDKCKTSYEKHWDKFKDEPIKNIPFALQAKLQQQIKADSDRRKLVAKKD